MVMNNFTNALSPSPIGSDAYAMPLFVANSLLTLLCGPPYLAPVLKVI